MPLVSLDYFLFSRKRTVHVNHTSTYAPLFPFPPRSTFQSALFVSSTSQSSVATTESLTRWRVCEELLTRFIPTPAETAQSPRCLLLVGLFALFCFSMPLKPAYVPWEEIFEPSICRRVGKPEQTKCHVRL